MIFSDPVIPTLVVLLVYIAGVFVGWISKDQFISKPTAVETIVQERKPVQIRTSLLGFPFKIYYEIYLHKDKDESFHIIDFFVDEETDDPMYSVGMPNITEGSNMDQDLAILIETLTIINEDSTKTVSPVLTIAEVDK